VQYPQTGYELSKEFDDKVSCYWQATSQQIYRELARMQEQGLVDVEIMPQTGRPDKKVYSLNQKGKEELIQWLALPSEPTSVREGLLLKVRGGFLVPEAVIIREIERRLQIHQAKLNTYRSMEANITSRAQLSKPDRHLYLTLSCGIRYETMWIEWCREAMAVLKAQEQQN
jgi:DNA-binding PadR family transcriptional regulator